MTIIILSKSKTNIWSHFIRKTAFGERGSGVIVWDETGNGISTYFRLSGYNLGHSHPVLYIIGQVKLYIIQIAV